MTNRIDSKLKQRSIKYLIFSPYFQIRIETRKKRTDLLNVDEIKNKGKEILNAPALMVNTLNGIGVKPAVKIIIKPNWLYWFCIF